MKSYRICLVTVVLISAFLVGPVRAAVDARHAGLTTTVQVNDTVAESYNKEILGDDAPPDSIQGNVTDCSGFIAYSRGTESVVVTARHCAEPSAIAGPFGIPVGESDLEPTSVQFSDGDVGIVKRIFKSNDADIAVLAVHSRRGHPYAFLSQTLRSAQPLFMYGFSNGFDFAYSGATSMQGDVDMRNSEVASIWPRTFLIDCSGCGHGDSGGGVYDFKGRVVGVLVGGYPSSSLFFIIPSAVVKTALDDFNRGV